MLVGNIEYLYPIVDFIKGAVFYDVGNVWRKCLILLPEILNPVLVLG